MHIAGELPGFGRIVRPDVAVTARESLGSSFVVFVPHVQGTGPVHAFLKRGGDSSKLDDPIAPLGSDHPLAGPGSDAPRDVHHEGVVAREVLVCRAGGLRRIDEMGIRRVLLLEVNQALGCGRWLDFTTNLHPSAW